MADLPGPWGAARRTSLKAQARGSALGFRGRAKVTILRDPSSGARIVVVRNAVYRCEQAVEAFVLTTEGGLSILVQPRDLNPETVARCSCLLDLAIAIPGAVSTAPAPHEQIRAVYLRGDRYGAKLGYPHVEKLAIARETQVGSWSDWTAPWKRAASDAWDDYKTTVRSYFS